MMNTNGGSTQSLAIVGAGMAGARLAELLINNGCTDAITLFGEEPVRPYNRILLSALLAGEKSPEDLPLLDESWYNHPKITWLGGDPVVTLSASQRTLFTRSGKRRRFDRIVIATGSRPHIPDIPGTHLPGVIGFRNLQDIALMQEKRGGRVLVVGGGLLGLEAAHGLNQLGCRVTVLHKAPTLMNRQLDATAAQLLRRCLEQRGIEIRTGTDIDQITGPAHADGIRLTNGERLTGDLIVFTTGITPNIETFLDSGLHIQRGLVVDDLLQCSQPGVYALGECCEHQGETPGIVAPIWQQAEALAKTLLGEPTPYQPRQYATRLKVSGIEVFSAGPLDEEPETRHITVHDAHAGIYRRLAIKENRLRGAVLFGDKRQSSLYEELIHSRREIEHPEALMF